MTQFPLSVGYNLSYLLLLLLHNPFRCFGLQEMNYNSFSSLDLQAPQLHKGESLGVLARRAARALDRALLPHRRWPPSLLLGSQQSQKKKKTVLGRGVRCPVAQDFPGCCPRPSSRQSPAAAAAAGRRPRLMSRAGEAAVQSRARRQRGHWLCAVTPRGAAAAASADWRAGRRVHAARAVPKPLRRGLAPPPHPPGTITPPLWPALQMKHLGPPPAAAAARPPGLTERARKARSQLGRTHRALRALQQLLPGRCAPPRPSNLHIPRF